MGSNLIKNCFYKTRLFGDKLKLNLNEIKNNLENIPIITEIQKLKFKKFKGYDFYEENYLKFENEFLKCKNLQSEIIIS